ncbi:MAG TPA: TonB-dependent receptor [Bryobacteraceae bacterium]|nr:TonB-dependent receptor [Bryobacteraceae bacterium]
MRSRLQGAAVLLLLVVVRASAAEVTLNGRVVDENNAPVPGAAVSLRTAAPPNAPGLQVMADQTGAFRTVLPAAGAYLVTVTHVDFFALQDRRIDLREGANEIVLTLNHVHNTSESVNVSASPSPIDIEQTDSERHLTGLEMFEIPYPNTHDFKNALPLTPGVLRDTAGSLHFDGGSENQMQYSLDGFNISDPLTGTFNTQLSVDAVQSVDFLSGRFSPEMGKGSSGALAVHTESGDDSWRVSATNFVPGVDVKNGVRIGTYTPRFNFSGPIRKGRAWFFNSVNGNYNQLFVPDLPSGQNTRTSYGGSDVLHAQFNATPANILFVDLLMNYNNTPNSGLGALDPIPTTTDQRSREWFSSIKDQTYVGRTLLEFGFADLRTFARVIPQGQATYLYTPNGRQGNNYIDSTQNSQRKQFLSNAFFPSFGWLGSHQIKAGIDADRLDYSQDTRRTAFDNVGLTGNVLRQVAFVGSGVLERPSLEASSYILDNWNLRPELNVQAGVRQDWSELVRDVALSPRLSFSYAPFPSKNTKVSGGYAVTYDFPTPQLFARPEDQYSLTTLYNPDGSIQAGPAATVFTLGPHLKMSRYQNWSLGLEQLLPERILLSLNLLRRRGSDSLTYVNLLNSGAPLSPSLAAIDNTSQFIGVYRLENTRRDSYDSAEIRLQQPFGNGYEWMASYTRSRASSNAVLDATVDQPTLFSENAGRLPWDAPNRFLSWGYLPTFLKNWTVAYLFETRTGFPFNVVDEVGRVLGAPSSDRFPNYLSLNLHLERALHLFGYRFALRGGFNNITNHNNFTVVNSTFGSPQFLSFYGSDGRHFVLRVRWFGRDTK